MLGSSTLTYCPYSDDETVSEINKIRSNKKLLIEVLSLVKLVSMNKSVTLKLELHNRTLLIADLYGITDGSVIVSSHTGIVGRVKISDIVSIEFTHKDMGVSFHG